MHRADAVSPLRRRILEAGSMLFRASPPASVQVDEIAEQAGVSRRTFYRNFKNGAHLFRALAADQLWTINGRLGTLVPRAADPAGCFVETYTDWWLAEESMAPRIHQESQHDAELADLRRQYRDRFAGVIVQAYQEANREADPILCRSLVTALDVAVSELPECEDAKPAEIERCRSAFKRLFGSVLR